MRFILSIVVLGLLSSGCGGSHHSSPSLAPVAPVVPSTPVSIDNTSPLPDATAGAAYSLQMVATGAAPFTWSVSGPAGLSINSSTGLLSGTTTTVGTQSILFTVRAGNGAQAARGYNLVVR